MGYTTDFVCNLTLDKQLDPLHHEYLTKFGNTRRMKRSHMGLVGADFLHVETGLGIGTEGEYFVDGGGYRGQDGENSVVDYNSPPATQPSLWCQWVPTEDGTGIEWDGGEKFYNYVEWLEYLIAHFLNRWDYTLNGYVHWSGERTGDIGTILVEDNEVRVIARQHYVPTEDGPSAQDEDYVIKDKTEDREEATGVIEDLIDELETITRAIDELNDDLGELETKKDDLEEQLSDMEVLKDRVVEKLRPLYDRLDGLLG